MTEVIAPLFALTAAAFFGFNVHIQQKGLDHADALTNSFISVAATAAMFWLLAPFFIEWHWWTTTAALIFAACGLGYPTLAQRLQFTSIGHIGPALTTSIGAFGPLFAVLPAVAFLGEAFGLREAAGLALMIGGLALAPLQGRGIPRNWPLWALSLALCAAFARGIVQPAMKVGFAIVNSPFFSALVMATVGTLVLGLMQLASKKRRPAPSNISGYGWSALSGVINGLGILAVNSAVSSGDVTIAAPLASTTPLWALAFGALLFRREHLELRHLIIAMLVVIGAVLIVTR